MKEPMANSQQPKKFYIFIYIYTMTNILKTPWATENEINFLKETTIKIKHIKKMLFLFHL